MKNKVFLMVLDGARLDVIEKWAKEGVLPTFEGLLDHGVSGDLETVFPPHSMLAYPSLLTGKNPGKHGIYNVQIHRRGTYDLIIPNFENVDGKTIFDYLTERGKTSVSVNVPMTFPPRKIRGIMISGWLTPPMSTFTYPRNISVHLKKMGYKIHPETIDKRNKNFLSGIYKVTEKRFEIVDWILRKYDWDFMCVVITGTEQMHHNYASFIDPEHPDYDPVQEGIVKKYYEYLDEKIAQLLSILAEDKIQVNAMIISDHGFGPSYGMIYLNNVLAKYGLFKKKRSFVPLKLFLQKIKEAGLKAVINRLNIFIFDFLPNTVKKLYKEETAASIDCRWSATKAYCVGELGDIRINVKGREPAGVVPYRKEYEKIREEIIEKIENDADIGCYIERIYRKEELFEGPYLKSIPDLYIKFKKCCTSSPNMPRRRMLGHREVVGFHTMRGLFMAYGPDMKEKMKVSNLKIIDIAPTILHMMGIPIPSDMDGSVNKEIFSEGSDPAERDILYKRVDEADVRKDAKRLRKSLSREDEEHIRERLRELGYL